MTATKPHPTVPRLGSAGGLGGGRAGGGQVGEGGDWGLAGTPLLPESPYGTRRRGAEHFEASILLAPKAPKQNFGCQPQTLEAEEWGGGGLGKGVRCTAVLIHPWKAGQRPNRVPKIGFSGEGCTTGGTPNHGSTHVPPLSNAHGSKLLY